MDYESSIKNLIKWGRTYAINIVASLILVLVFLIGLGIGLLTNSNNPAPIIIDKNVKIGLPANGESTINKPINATDANYVASINGKAYYPVNCKAAERIKEENKIWFTNSQEAEAQGYKLAQNCSR